MNSAKRVSFTRCCVEFIPLNQAARLIPPHHEPLLTLWTNWTNIIAMKTVNVHEAKTNFSSLLARVEKDSASIVICRNGAPIADLVPHKFINRIQPHPVLGKIKINYDPTEVVAADEWPEASR